MKRILLLFLMISIPALAALPPQDPEELEKNAKVVVTGLVKDVVSEKKTVTGGYNIHYTITLGVKKVLKGKDLLGQEKQIVFTCRQTGKRPRGWAGPQGQNAVPKQGDGGTFYLGRGKSGGYYLLSPNGWSQ